MEFYQELLLSALISVLLSLLLAKLADLTLSPDTPAPIAPDPVQSPQPETPPAPAPAPVEEEEWEWEGVEKSEVAERFAAAAEYVNGEGKLDGDVMVRLEALYRVATEGPCYLPVPSALNYAARAKWHAWQSLGTMSPDVAMEHYVSLLSQNVSGWMGEKPGGDTKHEEGSGPLAPGAFGAGTPDSGSSMDCQQSSKSKSETEEYADGFARSELGTQGLSKTLFLNMMSPTSVRFLCLCC